MLLGLEILERARNLGKKFPKLSQTFSQATGGLAKRLLPLPPKRFCLKAIFKISITIDFAHLKKFPGESQLFQRKCQFMYERFPGITFMSNSNLRSGNMDQRCLPFLGWFRQCLHACLFCHCYIFQTFHVLQTPFG